MNKDNISQKIADNIRVICKHKGKRIGDIETYIGKQRGYFSRQNRKISLDTAYKVSVYFGIPITDLIETDYAEYYRNEERQKEIAELEKRLAELKGEE